MNTATDVTITVNEESRTLPAGATCRDLVQQLTGREVGADGRPTQGAGLGIALAVDGALVPAPPELHSARSGPGRRGRHRRAGRLT